MYTKKSSDLRMNPHLRELSVIIESNDSYKGESSMKMAAKMLLIGSGFLFLGLGIIGIILPLIPTTPFLLLSAACFVRSSDRLYIWLLNNRWFGKYIRDFREKRGIPLKAKVTGIVLLWVSMIYSAFFVVPLVAVRVLLLLVAAYFTWYILSLKTLRS
ncbi:hypothetical protein EDD68_12225 [Melghiribacillus thermohalophilus]|uniref:DUF454 domain-containing protein n=2 Tax=Melghiribacillus thermohalophilus TaxID=1324956 RepID=A0A4R3MSF4_9BACI|nr:hypothetical protein EDD68_12225 [Melghiribacillus thermohalophilus]